MGHWEGETPAEPSSCRFGSILMTGPVAKIDQVAVARHRLPRGLERGVQVPDRALEGHHLLEDAEVVDGRLGDLVRGGQGFLVVVVAVEVQLELGDGIAAPAAAPVLRKQQFRSRPLNERPVPIIREKSFTLRLASLLTGADAA